MVEATDSPHHFRQWKSVTGKFEVRARLIRVIDQKVRLELDNGRTITVPIDKLSPFDREYIEALNDDNPFATTEPGDEKPNDQGSESRSVTWLIKSLNAAQKKLINNGKWTVTPDPISPTPPAMLDEAIAMPKNLDFMRGRGIEDYSVSIGGTALATLQHDPFEDQSELTVFDLMSGKRHPSMTFNDINRPTVAVSPSGRYAAVFSQTSGRDPGRIQFIEMGATPEAIRTWELSEFHHRGDGEPFEPEKGVFLSDNRFMTIDDRFIGVWDWLAGRAVYAFETNLISGFAISPTGKQIVVTTKSDKNAILATSSGKVLGVLNGIDEATTIAFSPNGRFLAGFGSRDSSVWIYDLVKNKVNRKIGAPNSVQSLQWVGKKHLLVNSSDLMDVSLGVTVWKFRTNMNGKLAGTDDGRFWFLTSDWVTPINLINPEIESKLVELKDQGLDRETLKLLKPGAKISVNLDVPFDHDQKLEIRQALVDKIESLELIIADDAEIQLTLKLTAEEEESLTVGSIFSMHRHTMPRFPGMPKLPKLPGFPEDEPDETVTSRPKRGAISLKHGERLLWHRTRLFGPFGPVLHRREGETAQQAIDRLCTPDLKFFTNWTLPQHHAQLPSGQPLGTSNISEDGIH